MLPLIKGLFFFFSFILFLFFLRMIKKKSSNYKMLPLIKGLDVIIAENWHLGKPD